MDEKKVAFGCGARRISFFSANTLIASWTWRAVIREYLLLHNKLEKKVNSRHRSLLVWEMRDGDVLLFTTANRLRYARR